MIKLRMKKYSSLIRAKLLSLFLILLFASALLPLFLNDILIVKFVPLLIHIEFIPFLWFLHHIEIHSQLSALDFSPVHLCHRLLCRLMSRVRNVREPFGLLCTPIVRHPDTHNLPVLSEPVSDIILLELVRQPLHKQSRAIIRHCIDTSRRKLPLALSLFDIQVSPFQFLSAQCQCLLL